MSHGPVRLPGTRAAIAALFALLAVLSGRGPAHAQVLLPVSDSGFQHLKFADSLTSVNDRCVITHNRLNPVIHPLYVNGQPVGFC